MKLRPYHRFDVDGGVCLINIEKTAAVLIDPSLARRVDELHRRPDLEPDPETAARLRELDLIAPDNDPGPRPSKAVSLPVISLSLFVTQECNFDCVYCYGDGGSYGSNGHMDRETAFKAVDWLIDQAPQAQEQSLDFFGGEPLLNFPLIEAVVEYATRRGRETDRRFRLGLTTNVSRLDEQKLAFIREHDLGVQVSFDGPAEIQDAQRPFKDGRGSYRACLPLIDRLLEVKPDTLCRATLMGGVDPFLVRDGLRRVGFQNGFIAPASPCLIDGAAASGSFDRGLSGLIAMMEQESGTLLESIKARRADGLKGRPGFSLLPGFVESFLINRKKIFYCGAGRVMAGVSAAGDIFPCHRFVGLDDYKLGNVFDGPLDRDRWLISQLRQSPTCADCFARFTCGGGCRHDNLGRSGNIFSPDEEMCRLIKRMTELAAAIAARLDEADRAWLTENHLLARKNCLLDF